MRRPNASDKKYRTRLGWDKARFEADMRDYESEQAARAQARSNQHRGHEVKAVARTDGKTDTYFGGRGKADGPGHGHVVTGPDGKVEYSREAE